MISPDLLWQIARARFEVAFAPYDDAFSAFFFFCAEVFEVGLAVAAADGLEVELDVVGPFGREGVEEVGAEFFSRKAGDAAVAPDTAEGVQGRFALGVFMV